MSSFDHPAPIVKPRTRRHKHLPVVAITGDDVLFEDGQLVDAVELGFQLPSLVSSLFVKQSAADFVAALDAHYSKLTPNWQWRASTNEREIRSPDGTLTASRMTTIIHYFGWKGGNFHKIIDPVSMYGHRLDTIWPGNEPPLTKLLQWGIVLRDFCEQNGMEVRPTIGSLSAQFLTDGRFYPNARRKVPAKINERAREALPGNHYVLTVHPTPHREFTAHYLDQHRAHHYHARTTPLPDADSLYAYGKFLTLSEVVSERPFDGFHGLYCLDLDSPRRWRRSHWLRHSKRQFVFSNELDHLTDMGYRVKGVRAAWGSFQRDTGLSRYASWAESQLDEYADAPWIKPLLLATYGTLATRPKIVETVFRLAKRGEPVVLRTGHNRLRGTLVQGARKLEPRIANVIHRGMIEAATRSESVGLGQYLANQGHHILSVYADAVIVKHDDGKPLPFIPEPWRLKQTLNHLQFINQQAFVSGEMTKLPGVSRELRDYARNSTGHAPRKVEYEAVTGRAIKTDRRI